MARSVECRCESRFTCGHCLRNAKPYHYTLSDGTRVIVPRGTKFKPPKGQ
jgi:hypothetical protein